MFAAVLVGDVHSGGAVAGGASQCLRGHGWEGGAHLLAVQLPVLTEAALLAPGESDWYFTPVWYAEHF